MERVIIGLGNGLSLIQNQAIVWTSVELFSFEPLGTNFNKWNFTPNKFSFERVHFKVSAKMLVISLNLQCELKEIVN